MSAPRRRGKRLDCLFFRRHFIKKALRGLFLAHTWIKVFSKKRLSSSRLLKPIPDHGSSSTATVAVRPPQPTAAVRPPQPTAVVTAPQATAVVRSNPRVSPRRREGFSSLPDLSLLPDRRCAKPQTTNPRWGLRFRFHWSTVMCSIGDERRCCLMACITHESAVATAKVMAVVRFPYEHSICEEEWVDDVFRGRWRWLEQGFAGGWWLKVWSPWFPLPCLRLPFKRAHTSGCDISQLKNERMRTEVTAGGRACRRRRGCRRRKLAALSFF
ncbi:hypothetical protein E3N88_18650 [Mikania micrantha]|uniref:Uncharacterized protein n=1 Tax=Mikania micrantha TaxID=192012 RepID=A0A5N6NLG0_9ASTR|nr:hypothetical protein E3N88_18650 [Mikania micrantha]